MFGLRGQETRTRYGSLSNPQPQTYTQQPSLTHQQAAPQQYPTVTVLTHHQPLVTYQQPMVARQQPVGIPHQPLVAHHQEESIPDRQQRVLRQRQRHWVPFQHSQNQQTGHFISTGAYDLRGLYRG